MYVSLERLCYLIEMINVPLRVRNNAFQRMNRARVEAKRYKDGRRAKEPKPLNQEDYKIYNEAYDLASKLISDYKVERKALIKEFNVSVIRMAMCPIVHRIYVKRSDGTTEYTTADIKKLAEKHLADLTIDRLLTE